MAEEEKMAEMSVQAPLSGLLAGQPSVSYFFNFFTLNHI